MLALRFFATRAGVFAFGRGALATAFGAGASADEGVDVCKGAGIF